MGKRILGLALILMMLLSGTALASESGVTFTDDLGREVAVSERPERVACLIGSFVVAATIWLLAYYGWKKTYQFWGAALVLSILLGAGVDILAGQLSSDLAIVNRNFAEVPLRCAVYVLIYQIPSWLLYRGSQQLARNLMQNRDS